MQTKGGVCFVGGGNMATALIGGLLKRGYAASDIIAADPSEEQRSSLSEAFAIDTTADNIEAVARASTLVLAVKPQIVGAVLAQLKGHLASETLVVSIAAGVTSASISEALGGHSRIVRAMPNTPALIGQGATGLWATRETDTIHRQLVEALFAAVGTAVWLEEEDDLHALTALSGSGPAYFFLLTEALAAAACELGLDRTVANQLAAQTALGAATLMADSGQEPATLRSQVTSPNGTTQAAIETFEAGGLRKLVMSAAAAAASRSRELAEEF